MTWEQSLFLGSFCFINDNDGKPWRCRHFVNYRGRLGGILILDYYGIQDLNGHLHSVTI
jgi:hypothetical protein